MLLNGLKVVEYATYIAAPGAGGLLSDWGADVVKIEPPGGDPIRRFFATIGTETADNPVFDLDNRGKRSAILDTSTAEGAAALRRMAAQADVFITNVRPGGLERSGLDYESLKAVNPRLVYASVTGYGLEGPEKDRPGFDMAAYWSRSGVAALHTPKGAEPFPIRTAMGDHVCSLATVSGILAALYARQETGEGRLVETSLARAATYSIGSDLAIQLRYGRLASNRPREQAVNPISNFFRTKDERWVCVLPRQSEADWKKMCAALGQPGLAEDDRFNTARGRRHNRDALMPALDAAFGALDFDALAARLDAEDIVWAPVQTASEVVADPQLQAAGCFADMAGPDGATLKTPAGPVRFVGMQTGRLGASPAPGGDTAAALSAYGFTDEEIAALTAGQD